MIQDICGKQIHKKGAPRSAMYFFLIWGGGGGTSCFYFKGTVAKDRTIFLTQLVFFFYKRLCYNEDIFLS